MKLWKRIAFLTGLCMLGLGVAGPAAAQQAYPAGVVNVLVGGPAGGPGDFVARNIVAHNLQEAWGQPVVTLNQVGAGGLIAANTVAKSAPDGRHILVDTTSFVINPTLHAETIPFDTLKDFAFVTLLFTQHVVLVAHAEAPFNTLPELIAYAKAHPGKVTYATPLLGSASHLAGEMLKIEAGIDMLHVSYKGSGPAMLDLVAGRVDTMFNSWAAVQPFVEQGKIKVIAFASSTRPADLKQYPVIAETIPGFGVTSFFGLMVRSGTPRPIIDKIQRDMAAAMKKPEVRAQLEKQGMYIVGSTPDEFDAFVRAEIVKWAKVVKAAKIKVN
ncbi:MAG: tripartite tricarboxylate transporter substrate binding protein [Burkholderiales bacterium]|nr:tripartite tricarboxylate transporter substrate binding protein [Burkholderiales bacterium]